MRRKQKETVIRWETRCESLLLQASSTIESVLQLNIPTELFQNVNSCLHLLLAMQASSASAERSLSNTKIFLALNNEHWSAQIKYH
jgi:hypothetical protein